MHAVRVDVRTSSGGYAVLLGPGLASHLGRLLDERHIGLRRFIVTNGLVWRLHGAQIGRALPGAEVIMVPDGERHKQLSTVSRIYEALVRGGADRRSVVVTVGGGVVGDMAGFAAATFLRGLSLVHVPTTLLAQVDASIGGKVGVNLAAGKNLVGAFHPPVLVVSDPQILRTLPRREFRAGLYEVIKYAMACSAELFERLRREIAAIRDPRSEAIGPIIADCCAIKAEVVSADERESGPRRVLNFGHTAGHAIEAITGFRRFRHGEAVAWGMLVATRLGVNRGTATEPDYQALASLVMTLGPLPHVNDLPAAQILESMRHDKKVANGTLHFVLPTSIGGAAIVDDLSVEELGTALLQVGFAGG